MKVLITGDPHLNFGDPGSCERKAVGNAFLDSFKVAVQHKCEYWIHTGDFVDGPVGKPDLTPQERTWARKAMLWAESKGVKTMIAPEGNHDIPKVINETWVSCYSDLHYSVRTYPSVSPLVDCLNFSPLGQDGAIQFFQKFMADNGPSDAHRLLIAHMLREGVHQYVSNRNEVHENWFLDRWCLMLKEKFPNIKVVLGHDHVPSDHVINGVPVHVIGSPVAMTFGDEHRRRFLIWDSLTGSIETIPLEPYLKQTVIRSMDEFDQTSLEHFDRVKLDFTVDNESDRSVIRDAVRGAKTSIKDHVKMAVDSYETILEGSLIDRWYTHEKKKVVAERGATLLSEMGA